jgi:hypothetical protein
LDKADQLAFIGSKLGVARRDGLAEESDRTGALMKDRPEARARRVALDDEVTPEVGKLENGR